MTSQLRGGGWRDIASAPKDGAEVIITGMYANGVSYVEVGRYQRDHWVSRQFDPPTHWQPLPPPPGAAAISAPEGWVSDEQIEAALGDLSKRLQERTAMRYIGDCKCGECQLVPIAFLHETVSALVYFRAALAASPPSPSANARVVELETALAEYKRRAQLNPLSGMSWGSGFNVWGDDKSMAEVRAAVHSHGQIKEFRTLIRHQREEIGKLHSQLRVRTYAMDEQTMHMAKDLYAIASDPSLHGIVQVKAKMQVYLNNVFARTALTPENRHD